jgi:hypothetical protein
VEVRDTYLASSKLTDDQHDAVARIGNYERHPSFSFPAGQLAALVYERTIPKSAVSTYAYQGCVYALAQGLEERLGSQ